MDDETRAYLETMEARVIGRIDDNHKQLVERMRGVEITIAALTELARVINTTLAVMTTTLTTIASSQTDLGRRITDLEKRT